MEPSRFWSLSSPIIRVSVGGFMVSRSNHLSRAGPRTAPRVDGGKRSQGLRGMPWWVTWPLYHHYALPAVHDLQVPYAPQIEPVSPAVASEPDEDVVAAWAADDGAQPPHLVNHRCPDLIGPSAVLAGVMRGGYLEGEDLPKGASCGVAVQSVFVHSSLTSSGSEAFGLDLCGVVPKADQRGPHRLHEQGRTAHEGERALLLGPTHLPKHLGVDAPVVAGPNLRPGARQGVAHLERTVSCCETFQLLAEDDLLVGARGVQQAGGYVAACGSPVADHRHQRRDARTPSNQEERSAVSCLPGKIATDRPPELQLVLRHQHVGEVNRHLAVVQTLHREHEPLLLRGGGYGVAPPGLVAVLGGEPHVDVLACLVALPSGNLEQQALGPRGLCHHPDHLRQAPQGPARPHGHLSPPSSAARARGPRSC